MDFPIFWEYNILVIKRTTNERENTKMKTTEIATYKRESTLWANARADKKTAHFVEMLCTLIDYDAPSEMEAKYGWELCKTFTHDGIQIHKAYKIECKGVNGRWTVLGIFNDDKESANQLVKQILNNPWYKGWQRVK